MAKMVRKASGLEIANHWLMALSCLLLAAQGFAFLFHLEGIAALFGGFASMRAVHNYLGLLFAASLVISIFLYLKEALTFDGDDARWLAVFGGYFNKKAAVPPMGRLNTGQKLYYLALLVLGGTVVVTGFILWPATDAKSTMLTAHLFHTLGFAAIMIAVPAHIYLGSLANPGSLQIMFSGMVPYAWAKKKHPKWVARLESHE